MLTFEDIVKRIDSLPPLSGAVIRIQQLYREGPENVDVIKLIKLVESDATLTADILKFVNDPKFGFSKKISSVSQAITLLGTETIYRLVIDYAMYDVVEMDVRPYGITNTQFNDICHFQSALVLQWISHIDIKDAQFLMPLALIMEIGKLILAKEISESSYTREFLRGLLETENVSRYEYELFETTSYYVSALLFEHWRLESRFVEILKSLDFVMEERSERIEYFRDILDVVRTAVGVKGILTRKSIEKAAQKVQKMGLSQERFLQVAKRLERNYLQSKGIV